MRKVSVFIGRFAPFHKGHYRIVKSALERTDYLVMIIGSHNKSCDSRDPLTTQERINIIQASLTNQELSRVKFMSVEDHEYNLDRWIGAVQTAAHNANLPWHSGPTEYYLVGMKKDNSSYYLNLFPNFKSLVTELNESDYKVNSTDIRKDFYENKSDFSEYFVTSAAHILFLSYMNSKPTIVYEYLFEKKYKEDWGAGPFVTVDSCIVQAGHVLLIQRGKEYGHKKWALPGGFIESHETTFDAAIRELREETKVKVPEKVLRGSLVSSKLYDYPYRSNRARILTNSFYFRLSDNAPLPEVKGSDDAIDARWVPISEFLSMRDQMFEDHYSMICDILKI